MILNLPCQISGTKCGRFHIFGLPKPGGKCTYMISINIQNDIKHKMHSAWNHCGCSWIPWNHFNTCSL